MPRNILRRIAVLPGWVKIPIYLIILLLALVALVFIVMLSPFLAIIAFLVLLFALSILVSRAIRRVPFRRVGFVALASLVVLIAFSGVSYAIYPELFTKELYEEAEQDRLEEEVRSEAEAAAEAEEEARLAEARAEEEARLEEEAKAEAEEEARLEEEAKAEAEADSAAEEAEQEAGLEEIVPPKEESNESAASSETAEEATDEEEVEYDETVTVKRVVDGDTVDISPAIDGMDRVRLIGVDTPETKEPGCEAQPYGEDASDFTTDELEGEEIQLEFDKDRDDRYDRLLAYVYKDDEMFNERLLEEGYAQVYTVSPNNKYEDRFEEAQDEAQEAEIGIWALSASEQDQLADLDNGVGGGEECVEEEEETPPEPSETDGADRYKVPDEPNTPSVSPPPSMQETPPEPPQPTPPIEEAPPEPPQAPAVQSGADCSTGVSDVPVVPGSKGDRDRDGIACES